LLASGPRICAERRGVRDAAEAERMCRVMAPSLSLARARGLPLPRKTHEKGKRLQRGTSLTESGYGSADANPRRLLDARDR